MKLKRKYITSLLPVAAAGVFYFWCIWYLRNELILIPISEIAKSEPHLTSLKMYVSFKAILLLLLLFLSAAVAISALLEYMRLSEGVIWYLTFGSVGAALSVPNSIRHSTSLEWSLFQETEEFQTVAMVLTVIVAVLLFASVAVFIGQVATERYRVRNLLDEVLTIILSIYLLRLLTGIHNTWYLVAAVSVSVPGMLILFLAAYINQLKTKLDVATKCSYNINEVEDYKNPEEAL